MAIVLYTTHCSQLQSEWCVNYTYCQDRWLQVQVDGVHYNEHLLVLVGETVGLSQRRLAVVLDPAVFAEEGRRQTQGQAQFKWETVDPWRQDRRSLTCVRKHGKKFNDLLQSE